MPRRYYSYRSSRRNADAARGHIAEARRLSAELGGADKDVKAYFFSLSPTALAPILKDYESRYGTSARQYAQSALPQWRNGRRQMSGLVAERLVDLLPPRMPLVEKYKLRRELRRVVGHPVAVRLLFGKSAGTPHFLSGSLLNDVGPSLSDGWISHESSLRKNIFPNI